MSALELRSALMSIIEQHEDGISVHDIMSKTEIKGLEVIVKILNDCTKEGLLEIIEVAGVPVYRRPNVLFATPENLTIEENIVFQCIKSANDRGIWTKDLKNRTGLHQTIMNKALKTLETKKAIKAVKNAKNPTRKTYMLFSITPSADFTGGPWFDENELDVEFIEETLALCLKWIATKCMPKDGDLEKSVRVSEICEFVLSSKVVNIPITQSDIILLLNRLIYDGLIEVYPSDAIISTINSKYDPAEIFLRPSKIQPTDSQLSLMPCGVCPVSNICNEDTHVTPKDCEYFNVWTTF